MNAPWRPFPVATGRGGSVTLPLRAALLSGPSTMVIGVVAALTVPGFAYAQAVNLGGAGVNNIIPDGRTATHLKVTGNQTAITTDTISRGTAFNSFSDFEEAAGQQVDLYVPNQAGNLVNIVRNGPVVVNGVLNAYKSGRIGGNVFFSDSHGFIVGQSGTVNVGALTVNTPTDKFLDGVVGADGKVNDTAAGQLMTGQIPLSDDGLISISGTINAKGGITLQGQTVVINGPSGQMLTGDDLTQREKFQATVNTGGIVEGGRLVVSNGSISIVAAGNVHVAGHLTANASKPGRGGKISIRSGGNTTLASTAALAANGLGATGAGGDISVIAVNTLTAMDGASLSARGAGTGAGGFVELSGHVASIGAIKVDLGSDQGKAGTLLFDPYDLIIGATGSAANTSYSNSLTTNGANVVLSADHSITLATGGFINTQQIASNVSTGNSGDISLTAPSITISDGSQLEAGVSTGSGFHAGDITLTATQPTGGTAQIIIGSGTGIKPIVDGRNITLTATSTASDPSILVSTPTAHADITITGAQITATGALNASATAATSGNTSVLPVGVVVTDVESSVNILGASVISAATAELAASSTADSLIKTQSLAPANASADGAVAVSTVKSFATSHIGDSAQVTTTGALSLTADNTVVSTALAQPQAAAFGASVAVSIVTATTKALIDGSATVGAGSLSLAATTSTAVTVTAAAAAGGATAPSSGSKASSYLSNPDYTPYENTGEGKLSVVGALAISDLKSTTTTSMSASNAATVGGALSLISTSSNSADVTADGSATNAATGVGVALGINLAKVKNDATLAQAVTAASLTLNAVMNGAEHNAFTTSATSGAGASNVGLAGSLAVNLVDTESVANLGAGASIAITGGGAVNLGADDETESSASALPSVPTSGGKVGIGASVALNIVANRSLATVDNGVAIGTTLTPVGDLILSANAVHTVDTVAKAGATSTGGVALTPALALSMVNNTTTAQLGTLTGVQAASGKVTLAAAQQATETTTASGKAAGGSVAIGAALALSLINDNVSATTLRDIHAGGDVGFTAWGSSLSTLTAEASAAGASSSGNESAAEQDGGPNVDTTVNSELGSASDKQSTAGVGDATQEGEASAGANDKKGHSASTSQGKVSVAAAIGINVQTSKTVAAVPDQVNITSGGTLSIHADNNTDGNITADGSAVGGDNPPKIGIGAAVAVNVVHTINDATLGDGTHQAAAIDISALKLDVAKLMANKPALARSDTYLAGATSGAGGSTVGLAGSLGLNLIDTESVATIAKSAHVTVGGGDVALTTDNRTGTTATAKADATGGKVGVGASVALNIIANRSLAEVGDGAFVTGARNLSLSANAVHTIDTEVEAGSAGGVAITPALALTMANDTTTADLGTLTVGSPAVAQTMSVSGVVTIAAAQQATETTKASGKAAGGSAAVGAALALALISDDVTATTNRNLTSTGGAITFSAMGASLSTLEADASAMGAAPAEDDGSAAPGESSDVDTTTTNEFKSSEGKQKASGVGDSKQQGATDTGVKDGDSRSASTSEGKVTVAAAVGVNVQESKVVAAVPDGIVITTPGKLTIKADNNTDGSIKADGSAVGDDGVPAAKVGIGAAVAVNVVHATNDATLGVASHSVGALDIEALKLNVAALVANPNSTTTRADTYLASATSGAGASNVGIAGSLGLNLIDTESVASIANGAHVTVGGGDVMLATDDRTGTTATAKADATGGKVGVGASVALNIIANRSLAEIGDGVFVTGAHNLSLSANAIHTIDTEVEAGSAGGVAITPALALTMVDNTTTADLGTLTAGSPAVPQTMSVSGVVTIAAAQQATETTKASGKASGGKAAVGAALALALINDDVTATTNRNLTSTGGAITFSAMGASLSTLEADASAMGAAPSDDESADEKDGGSNVDSSVNTEMGSGSSKQKSAGVGNADQQQETSAGANDKKGHSASTTEGKVTVAAAVGVNVQESKGVAAVPDGVAITTPGKLTIKADNNTDGSITADGSAVGTDGVPPAKVGIGAAVAVNVVHVTNNATLGVASHSVGALDIEALKLNVAALVANPNSTATRSDTYLASATSGAGGSSVGLAGSLGLNLIDTQSAATVTAGSSVNVTGVGPSLGDVTLSADNQTGTTADATADATGGKLGIGASVALNIVANRSLAEIGNGAIITGVGALTLSATAVHSVDTDAEAGAAGGVALTPALGLAIVNNTTTADLGTLPNTLAANNGIQGALGDVSITADQSAAETTKASGKAAGDKAAIGAALALALVDDEVSATTHRAIAAGGDVSFSSTGASIGILEADASASGAEAANDDGSSKDGKTVDDKVDGQFTSGETKQSDANVGSTTQRSDTSSTQSGTNHSAASKEGKISVAAAVAVNVVKSSSTAELPDGINISSGGTLNVQSVNATDGTVTADASATGAQVGIAAAAAVNAITETNIARLGNATYTADDGVNVTALKPIETGKAHVDTFETKATSGAGGSKIGLAGSLALNLVNVTTTAEISGSAVVDAGTGTDGSVISADEEMAATASALPSGDTVGGKLGIGASVALNLITSTTTAQIDDGAGFAHGADLSVTASSGISTTTEAEAGAGGGVAIDAVVALAILDETTTARIGTGAALDLAGALDIEASNSGENEAKATGDTKSTSVGIGAAAAVIVGGGTLHGALSDTSVTSAELARDLTAAALTITAESERTYEASATATAGGGKDNTENSGATSTKTLADTKDSQKGTSGGGKVAIAAAVGVAAAQDAVSATLDGVIVHLTGNLEIGATNATDVATLGSGAAEGSKGQSAQVGIGVGVALSIVNNSTHATIANSAHITQAGDIDVTAASTENIDHATGKTDFLDGVGALAYAGASSTKVSVAGALAVAISTATTSASIGDTVNIDHSGAINVATDNTSKLTTKAASEASGGQVGVGASVATVYSDNNYSATIGSGTNITADNGVTVRATNHKVTVPSSFQFTYTSLSDLEDQVKNKPLLGTGNYYAEAIGGSEASKVAVDGSFAVMVFDDSVTATIGQSVGSTSTAKTAIDAGTGAVTLLAQSDFDAKALSGGLSVGGNAGVGLSSSVIDNTDTIKSLLSDNAQITHSASFSNQALATQNISVFGISAAGGGTAGIAGVATVITSANDVEALIGKHAVVVATGAVTLSAANSFTTLSLAGGAAGGGTAGIGAVASVVTVDNKTIASIADGTSTSDAVVIDAGGVFNIGASATESGQTYVAAGAAAGNVAVGAGAGVYILGTNTEALVGAYAEIGQTTKPSALAISASDVTTLNTLAGAAAGGGSVGAGAGVAVGTITKTVAAQIGGNAEVKAGNVSVAALSTETGTVLGAAAGIGGDAGLAGAVSAYVVTDTTTAEIGGSAVVHADDNVAVLANDATSIDSIDGSGAVGGAAGIGASVGLVIINSTTHAKIDDLANVTALGNGSALTYIIGYDGTFSAYGGSEKFEAPAINSSNVNPAAGVGSSALSAKGAEAAGLALLTETRTSTPITATGSGVIVNATDTNKLRSLVVGGAAGGSVAVSISATVPIITTDTEATIGSAQINQGTGTANTVQGVFVAAASDLYDLGVAGSVAGGGAVGGGAGMGLAIVTNTTKALASPTAMAAAGDISVTAKAREDFALAAAAGALGGTVSLAGGVSTVVLTDVTTAELGGVAVAQGNVNVIADDETRLGIIAGSISISGVAGFGASVGVVDLNKTTTADIANSAHVTALGNSSGVNTEFTGTAYDPTVSGATQSGHGINVVANSGESDLTIAVAGAAGLYAGVSGVVSLELFNITTTADIGNSVVINGTNTNAGAQQDVAVAARDTSTTLTLDGGFAAGLFAGLNGTIDVGVFKNTTDAFIGNNTTVNAKRDVLVSALANKAGDSTTISAGIGAVALAAGISIYDYGDGIAPGSDAAGHIGKASDNKIGLNDITDQAQSQVNDGTVNTLLSGSSNSGVVSANNKAKTGRNAVGLDPTSQLSVPAGTSASVRNAHVNAGGALGVHSLDALNTNFTTGALAGGAVGLGAGVGVVTVDTTNTAQITGATITSASLAVAATTQHTLNGLSIAGAFGLGLGLEASIAVADDTSTAHGSIDGSALAVTGGAVAVNVSTTRTATTTTYGAAIAGTAAVGVSLADAEVGGEAEAWINNTTIGTSGARVGSVTVGAYSGDSADAESTAVSGGLGLAAEGSVSTASVTPVLSAYLDKATIYANGQVLTSADAENKAKASSTGLAIAGILAAGASVAQATVAAAVTADVYGGSLLDAGSIEIDTTVAPLGGTAVTAAAKGSSGAIVGLTATEADATNSSTSHASAESSTLKSSGLTRVKALNTTLQNANASGLAVGIVAAGSNTARATANTATRATLLDLVSLTAGNLSVLATGSDNNTADATSGSGGLVAGAAAEADTSDTSVTDATADTDPLSANYTIAALGGLVDIEAKHTATFAGDVDSTQAAVVGMSGATLNHAVNSAVDAHLGDNAIVRAANLTIAAQNLTHNFFDGEAAYGLYPGATAKSNFDADNAGWNVDSGSGGLINLPAGAANVTVAQTTNASIGDHSDVHLLAPTSGVSTLSVEAYNEVIAHQKSKLDSGGLIATAEADVDIEVPTDSATVSFGDNSSILVDIGDIEAAAWGNADLDGRSAATVYGLAGAPSGKSYANLTVSNAANVGTNTRIESTNGINPVDGSLPSNGTVSLAAGDSLTGLRSNLLLHTTVDLYNKTAIPISTTPDAQANLLDNATLTIDPDTNSTGTHYGINAAGDITLSADRGNITTSAVGTGKDIYLEALAAAASAISHVFGGGDITFDHHGGSTSNTGLSTVRVDGRVDTGLQRVQSLTLNYQTTDSLSCADVTTTICLTDPISGEIVYTTTTSNSPAPAILARLQLLQTLIAQDAADPIAKGAYANEIAFLEEKLVGLGLGSFTGGVFSLTPFAAGKSPYAVATDKLAVDTAQFNNVAAQLGAATVIVDTTAANAISVDYSDASHGFQHYATVVQTTIGTLGNFSTLNGTGSGSNATFKSEYAALTTDLATASGYQSTIASKITANGTLKDDIAAQVAIIGNVNSTSGAVTAAQTQINTDLVAITSNDSAIATATNSLSTKISSISATLGSLVDLANSGNTNDTNAVNALKLAGTASQEGGALWAAGAAVTDVSSQLTAVTSANSAATTRIGILNGTTTGIGNFTTLANYVTSALTLQGIIGTDKTTQATASTALPTGPVSTIINVPDVAARLGNIGINAEVLVGTGQLQAPGDASITITNNTADSLSLGNLSMPTYDAGHLRLNGVLVNSSANIQALNVGHVTPGFSDSNIVTSLTSSRAAVTIISNYNPQSAQSVDSSSTVLAFKTPLAPPDIVLQQGKVINNPLGAVNITSASGNIYVNGKINAGSVTILAKNGDFVSSYVDGFDPIGGDPASFNDPTNAAEAGIGIIANGAISISARYLNINSTIQSGIANWNAVLTDAPTLTANNPSLIGVSATDIATAETTFMTAITNGSANATATVTNNKGQSITLDLNPTDISLTDLHAAIADYDSKIVAHPETSPMYSVHVGSGANPPTEFINIKDYLTAGPTGRLEFSIAQANAFLTAGGTTTGIFGVVSPTSNIGVSYNAHTSQYVLDGTEVHGGYIQLYGQIINTADVGASTTTGGQLNVLDGFGTINVQNTSDIPVVLQTLDTGADPTGTSRGTAGVIDITDVTGIATVVSGDTSVTAANPRVSITHTTYTRDGGIITQSTQHGTLDNKTGNIVYGNNAISSATTSGRDSAYDPSAGQRYVWTTATDSEQITYLQTDREELFGSSSLTIDENTSFSAITPGTLSTTRLADGTYVTDDITRSGTTGFRSSIALSDPGYTTLTNTDASVESTQLITSNLSYITNAGDPNYLVETSSHRDCNWWTACIDSDVITNYTLDQKYTTITTNSLKADNPISIHFIGSDTGGIAVDSKANVILDGAITSKGGSVSICAGVASCGATALSTSSIISANNGAVISAQSVSLKAAGFVGGLTNTATPQPTSNAAVNLALLAGPSSVHALVATAANGSVSINAAGDLLIEKVTAAGNPVTTTGTPTATGLGAVNLTASGSIVAANLTASTNRIDSGDTSALIQAPRVSLTATNGAIGSIATPLIVDTGYIANDPNRVFGDPTTDPSLVQNPYLGLSASAAGDIGIEGQSWTGGDGTILVDQVISLGGNVLLRSPGQILDNNPVESVDTRTYAELLGYWNSLGLLGVDTTSDNHTDGVANAAKQAATIQAFENSKTQAYDLYWEFRSSQPDNGATYNPNFVVTIPVGSAQYNALTQQFTASEQAAHPGDTPTQIATAVTTDIGNFAASETAQYHQLNSQVGSLTATFNSKYAYKASPTEQASLTDGAVWTQRELAFSLSPGALKTITATNPTIKAPNVAGQTVTIDAARGVGETAETIANGVATPGISILASLDPSKLTDAQKVALATAERSDLELVVGAITLPAIHTAQQQLDYNAAVTAGITASTTTVPLGSNTLTAAQQAALNAAADGLVANNNLTITVLSKRPLNFSAPAGLNVTVTAATDPTKLDQGDAYLASRSAALLGAIAVPGETRIKTIGSIGNTSTGSSIQTGNLILESAQGSIGSSGTPLNLHLNAAATFTGRAQQGVFVNFTGDALIDTVYSPQNVTLKATGSLLNANGDQLINILGTDVTLTATSGSIGATGNFLNVGNNLGGGIYATASAGAIDLYGPSNSLFIVKSADAGTSVDLVAAVEGVIDGTVKAPGEIDIASGGRFVVTGNGKVDATTTGKIAVNAASLKMLDGAIMFAEKGDVAITTTGDALVTGITSGSTDAAAVTITAGGHVLAGTASGRTDVATTATGAGIKIVAGQGVGDETEVDSKYQDGPNDVVGSANLVTAIANPLRLSSAMLDLTATTGDVDIEALLAVTSATVSALAGNINVTADHAFHANLISAPNGNAMIDANGDLIIDKLRAKTVTLDSAGALNLPDLEIAQSVTLGAGELTAHITQVPSGPDPLNVNLTGYKGTVGTSADVTIDAPAGVDVGNLKFVDAVLGTNASHFSVASAFIPGSLKVTSPFQTLFFNDRSPFPTKGADVQLYQPTYAFSVLLDDYHTTSDAFVVQYQIGAQVTDVLGGVPYDGASLVRDSVRVFRNGDATLEQAFAWIDESGQKDKPVVTVEGNVVIINGVAFPIETSTAAPAVNLGGIH